MSDLVSAELKLEGDPLSEGAGDIDASLLDPLRRFEEAVTSALKKFERKVLLWGWGAALVTSALAFAPAASSDASTRRPGAARRGPPRCAARPVSPDGGQPRVI
jgi:hypothetical protein